MIPAVLLQVEGAGEGREDRASTLRLDLDASPSMSLTPDPSPRQATNDADVDSETFEAEGKPYIDILL